MKLKALLLGAGTVAALYPVSAMAQTTAPATVVAPTNTDTPADTPANTGNDIVVTAQRRSEKLVNVPIAVSTASGAELKASGATDLADLASVTSGLSIPKVGGMAAPTIRGIGTRSVSPGDEQVVPVYIDGIYQAVLQGASYDLGDVERVEVLKGPQSALYGRNATGGALNIVTLKPAKGVAGDLQFEAGSLGHVAGSGYLGAGGDLFSGTLTFAIRHTGDYIHDIGRGVDTGAALSRSVRAKILVTPSPRDELMFSFSFADGYDRAAISYRVLNGNTSIKVATPTVLLPSDRFDTSQTQDNNNNRSAYTYNFRYTHNFDAFNLVSLSSLQNTSFLSDFDGDNTLVAFQRLYINVLSHSFYHEDYLASSKPNAFLTWTVGDVYYSGTTRLAPQIVSINRGFGLLPATQVAASTDTSSFALYGEVGLHFTDQLALIGAVRQTWERRTLDNTVTTYSPPGAVLSAPSVDTHATFSKFTPTATLQWKPTNGLDLYLRYAQAFKAGLYNVVSASTAVVQPEEVTQYEFGAKSSFSAVVYLNGSVYRTDYKNLQVTSLVNGIATLSNAAKAQITGAEGEIGLRPVKGLNLHGSINYTDATYREFTGAIVYVPNATNTGNVATVTNVSGQPLVLVPKWSGNAGLDYRTGLAGGELTFNANAQFSGSFDRTLDGRIKQPAYTVVNAEIGYRLPRTTIRVAVFARNLFDAIYDNTVVTTPGGDSHSFGEPRYVGGKVSITF